MKKHKQTCRHAQHDGIFPDTPLYECTSSHFCESQVRYGGIIYCAVELNRESELQQAGMLETAIYEERGKTYKERENETRKKKINNE